MWVFMWNLNTSYVKVKRSNGDVNIYGLPNLNTSYVKVKPTLFCC